MKTWNLPHYAMRGIFGIGCGIIFAAISGSAGAAPLQEVTMPNRALTIQQLEGAAELDNSRASVPNIDPISRQDLLVQARDAELMARRLQYGADIPQAEIDAAMVIPNEPRSSAANARLISRLKEARHLDHAGIRDYNVDPVYSQDFEVQASRINQVLANLEVGRNVSRVEINQALEVPPNP